MTDSSRLGEYLKQKRGDQSLRDFAKKLKISHTHLDSLEKGFDPRTGKPVRPTTETITKIAKGLGVEWGKIFFIAAEDFTQNFPAKVGDEFPTEKDKKNTKESGISPDDVKLLKKIKKLPYKDRKLIDTIIELNDNKTNKETD